MKKLHIALLSILAIGATSCDDFLDVRPKGEKVENDQFKNAKGFEDAIYGVYGSMGNEALYGRDLLWGITEILAQNLRSDSQFGTDMSKYDYTSNSESRTRFLAVWTKAYESIGYANNVLQNLEKKSPESMPLYDRYKGEMLATRALLHFDLLRLFAPTEESKRGIPYVTSYTFSVKPFYTVKECYDFIIKDLTDAEKLLKDDEETVTYPRDNNRYDQFLNWRETHMNLYAVKALLARVYWYRGDMANAAIYATQVVDSEKFPLVEPTEVQDFLAGVLSPKETLFGIYSTSYLDTSKDFLYSWRSYHSYAAYDDEIGKSYLEPWNTVFNRDIDGTAQDFRRQQFRTGTGITYMLKLVDYKTIEETERDKNLISGMTVIHRSELNLIAAEALLATDYNRAVGYFNDEIASRGLPKLRADETLTADRIYNEYRKEMFCEGQQWFNMKRLNRDIISNYENRVIPGNDNIYVLPIPQEEFEYRPQN